MKQITFLIYLILLAALGPGDYLAFNIKGTKAEK
jgi:hypothetical protein